MSEKEDYEDLYIELSEDEQQKPTEPEKNKRKYTMSDKAKEKRIENLRIGRERRQQMLQRKRQDEARLAQMEQEVDEDEYSEYSSDDDVPPPAPASRSKARQMDIPKYKRKGLKNKLVEDKLSKMEMMMEALFKKNKAKRNVIHKTVIVPNTVPQPSQQKEQAKKVLLDIF